MSIANEIIDGLKNFAAKIFSCRKAERARMASIVEPLLIKALAVRDVVNEVETTYFFGRTPSTETVFALWNRVRAHLTAYCHALTAARQSLGNVATLFDQVTDECVLFLNAVYHEKVEKPQQGLLEDPAELALLYTDFTRVNRATVLYSQVYDYCKKYFMST